MKAKWLTPLLIAMFSGALVVGGAVGAGGMRTGATADPWHGFNKLDEDGDGHISQQEANAHPTLAEHFMHFDKNKNGHLEQGEFAQFQTMQRGKHRTSRMEQNARGDHGDYHEAQHW